MIRLQEVVAFLREFAPPELAEDWDNVGLLIGDPADEIRSVLTCLTLTPNVAVILSPPVGKGQAAGDIMFDPSLITDINDLIRTIAAGAKLPVFSLAGLARPDGYARVDVTLDGVHLSAAGYAVWNKVVAQAWQTVGICE